MSNAIDLTLLISLSTSLREWISQIKEGRDKRDSHYNEAIASLAESVRETKFYIASFDRPFNQQFSPLEMREREEALTRSWTVTASKIRPYDPDLAGRCLLKGNYWTDSSKFDDDYIRESRIQIDSIFEDVLRLVKE